MFRPHLIWGRGDPHLAPRILAEGGAAPSRPTARRPHLGGRSFRIALQPVKVDTSLTVLSRGAFPTARTAPSGPFRRSDTRQEPRMDTSTTQKLAREAAPTGSNGAPAPASPELLRKMDAY